jgi:hypothetical protein
LQKYLAKKCHKFDTTMFQITKKTGDFDRFQKMLETGMAGAQTICAHRK